jgi:PAS domain S-box-containing protein
MIEALFPGDSELARLMRALDWSRTDLGAAEDWPEHWRTAVRLCLTCRIPIVLCLGPSFTVLYNDPYISFLRQTKHPGSLGRPGREVWSERWDTIGPMLLGVHATGLAAWCEDLSISFGPILGPDGKSVDGIFGPCTASDRKASASSVAPFAERERFYSLFEQAPIPMVAFEGPDLRLVFQNRASWPITYRPEALGKPLSEGYPEIVGQGWYQGVRRAYETGETTTAIEAPIRILSPTGVLEERYFNTFDQPLRDEVGRIVGVMTVGFEVTQQVIARRALEESEERFRNMADNAPVMIWVTDPNAECTYLNRLWYEITGQTPETGLGFGWVEAIHPEDRKRAREEFVLANSRLEPFRLEYRLRQKDGEYLWVIDSAAPRLGPGRQFLGYIGSVIDITERRASEVAIRASEERFRHIFETAEVSMWDEDFSAVKALIDRLKMEHGPDLRPFLTANPAVVREAISLVRIRDVNPATLRMLGATSKEQLLGSLHTIFLPETEALFLEELLAIAAGQQIFSAESPIRTLRGDRMDVLFSMGFTEADRSMKRVLITLMDISSRKVAEAEREARLAEAERALSFSDRFVGILGHDLRNPLAAIMSSADLLMRRETSERIARPIQRIRTSADRMNRMIGQILDFTRARLGGGIPIAPAPVDLQALAGQIMEEMEGAAPRPILLETAGDLRGEWDGDRLAQVISNLLGNAVEHGDARQPVRLRLDGSRSDLVLVEVWNAGAIPEQRMGQLFDPFTGAGASGSAQRPKGLGLGLYIVQQIVLAHGGRIDVRSSAGEGTTFSVSLPRSARKVRGG